MVISSDDVDWINRAIESKSKRDLILTTLIERFDINNAVYLCSTRQQSYRAWKFFKENLPKHEVSREYDGVHFHVRVKGQDLIPV